MQDAHPASEQKHISSGISALDHIEDACTHINKVEKPCVMRSRILSRLSLLGSCMPPNVQAGSYSSVVTQ